MKTKILIVVVGAFSLIAGCASSSKSVEQAAKGPLIVDPRSSPDTVELNQFLQPKNPQQFLVEVQDMASPVTDVKMRVAGTPIEVPMERIGGTTFRGALSSDQIKQLAISGQNVKYEGTVVATDANGTSVSSEKQAQFNVKTPEFKTAED